MTCPKCGAQVMDPFSATIVVHDVAGCGGLKQVLTPTESVNTLRVSDRDNDTVTDDNLPQLRERDDAAHPDACQQHC